MSAELAAPAPELGPAGGGAWVDAGSAPLLTDLYQLTMLQAYEREGLDGPAVFELFVRRLPSRRNVLLACGLDDALVFLERLAFDESSVRALASLGSFHPEFLARLARLRFTGDVWAMPEGTPFFAGEPLLRVRAPLPEAQVVETLLLNQVHFQTLAASAALRVVTAAAGRPVVDFGLRRTHGADAGLKAARAFHVAGVAATSNVLAGRLYGVPLSGTMAHSYIQAHDAEVEAFRAFAELYPETVLLVDTYDTLEGVRRVAALARELGEGFRIRAVRLDSGDLAGLARAARAILDAAGLERVEIFASGGLDDEGVAELVASGAPVDGFGVGTRMGVSADAPHLDCAYKLVEYAGRGRAKLSPGKVTPPGAKQVFRLSAGERDVADVVAPAGADPEEVLDEARAAPEGARTERDRVAAARPLLVEVIRGGRRTAAGSATLDAARRRAAEEVARLPERVRALAAADPPYPVLLSRRLREAAAFPGPSAG